MKFIDLNSQYKEIQTQLYRGIRAVFNRGDFILGRDVKLFEEEFARFCGTKYCVGVSSGTDALLLALKSVGVGAGDEVIVPVFTFIATANAVSYTTARPVFVDIDPDTYCLNVRKLEKAITSRTKAIIPVHLFGQPADMEQILKIAKKYNLRVIEDAAQAHGAIYNYRGRDRRVGSLGDVGCFSFYPTKNLAGCGDAGAITTNNKKIYERLLVLRDCGRVSGYEHKIIGYNARLDTLQAVALRIKLKKLEEWNRLRRKHAKVYNDLLSKVKGLILPYEKDGVRHVYHLYVVRTKKRQALCRALEKHNIPYFIYYPIPVHLQKAYKNLGYKKGDFPEAEKAAAEVLSLPMHPFLKKSDICYVAKQISLVLS
jgi:dTDP-4-amino-4,6-dideoxygalactose transaminase